MNLDVWEVHEVFGNVNNKLIHESRSNVISIHAIIKIVSVKSISTLVRGSIEPFKKTKKRNFSRLASTYWRRP